MRDIGIPSSAFHHTHLPFPLGTKRKQVVQCPIVDAATLHVVDVAARHGVRLAAASLAVRKDANVVACDVGV